MSVNLGEKDYRRAGLQRIPESWLLLSSESTAGSVYLAGRAVESMLRALIWTHDPDVRFGRKSLDTGHDFRQMLSRVMNLGALNDFEHRGTLAGSIQRAARLWHNNMRFFDDAKLANHWHAIGAVTARRSVKIVATSYYQACFEIVKRCEARCASSRKTD